MIDDRQINRQTDTQIDRQIGRQTNRWMDSVHGPNLPAACFYMACELRILGIYFFLQHILTILLSSPNSSQMLFTSLKTHIFCFIFLSQFANQKNDNQNKQVKISIRQNKKSSLKKTYY